MNEWTPFGCSGSVMRWSQGGGRNLCPSSHIMHSYRHTALSEISITRIVGVNITTQHLISCTIFSDMGFTDTCIVVRSTGQADVETKYKVPTVRGHGMKEILLHSISNH